MWYQDLDLLKKLILLDNFSYAVNRWVVIIAEAGWLNLPVWISRFHRVWRPPFSILIESENCLVKFCLLSNLNHIAYTACSKQVWGYYYISIAWCRFNFAMSGRHIFLTRLGHFGRKAHFLDLYRRIIGHRSKDLRILGKIHRIQVALSPAALAPLRATPGPINIVVIIKGVFTFN